MTINTINSNSKFNDKVDFQTMVNTISTLNQRIDDTKSEEEELKHASQTNNVNFETQIINRKTLVDSYKNKVKECKDLSVEVKQLLRSIEELRVENEVIDKSMLEQSVKFQELNYELCKVNGVNNKFKVGVLKKNIKIKELMSEVEQLTKINKAYDDRLEVIVKRNGKLTKIIKSIKIVERVFDIGLHVINSVTVKLALLKKRSLK